MTSHGSSGGVGKQWSGSSKRITPRYYPRYSPEHKKAGQTDNGMDNYKRKSRLLELKQILTKVFKCVLNYLNVY